MTTPSPYETRGWRGRLLRAEAVVPQQAVPSVVAAPAAASREPSGSEALPPGLMRLALEGAATDDIIISRLHKIIQVVTIDGGYVRRTRNGYFKIPMNDGRSRRLTVRSWLPGYPTVKFRGTTLYRAPRPPILNVAAFCVALLGVFFAAIAFAGGGWMVVGLLAARIAVPLWMNRSQGRAIPVLILCVGIALTALGIAGLQAHS